MTEQWKELKETIIEMRDNDGTATQQEVCKFLANLMNVLEKQMQEPCDDAINRQVVKEQMIKYGFHAPDMTVTEFVEDLPPVKPQDCDSCEVGNPCLYCKHEFETQESEDENDGR